MILKYYAIGRVGYRIRVRAGATRTEAIKKLLDEGGILYEVSNNGAELYKILYKIYLIINQEDSVAVA